jgi:hypothetical protein
LKPVSQGGGACADSKVPHPRGAGRDSFFFPLCPSHPHDCLPPSVAVRSRLHEQNPRVCRTSLSERPHMNRLQHRKKGPHSKGSEGTLSSARAQKRAIFKTERGTWRAPQILQAQEDPIGPRPQAGHSGAARAIKQKQHFVDEVLSTIYRQPVRNAGRTPFVVVFRRSLVVRYCVGSDFGFGRN